jgi:hypothetical protein
VAVRRVIESLGSAELRSGFRVGIYNKRGTTTRAYAEGGRQERKLAEQYRAWAAALSAQWPLTAEVLREVSDSYELDARREDEEAQARLDR